MNSTFISNYLTIYTMIRIFFISSFNDRSLFRAFRFFCMWISYTIESPINYIVVITLCTASTDRYSNLVNISLSVRGLCSWYHWLSLISYFDSIIVSQRASNVCYLYRLVYMAMSRKSENFIQQWRAKSVLLEVDTNIDIRDEEDWLYICIKE